MTTLVDAPSRAKNLKVATQETHERLDKRIMATNLFASRALYSRFLTVQHAFHRDIDALYDDAQLAKLLPDLAPRRRLPLICRDLDDLGMPLPASAAPPAFDSAADVPTALGWLYVAEGSNLGAAFLLKGAAALDLNEQFGARHLAAAPEGRGLAWRSFTAALDAAEFSAAEETRVVDGAVAAFARVTGLVETLMPLTAERTGDAVLTTDGGAAGH